MILWLRLLLGCLVAPATNVSTAVESATPEEDGDPMPICTRNRGPPPAGRPGYRTARSADNGTCPIHLRPVPSRSDPGCRSPEHQQRTTPHASPSDSRRSDQPTETPDRVEQPQATPAPGRFQPERVAGLNRNGWPNSPECTLWACISDLQDNPRGPGSEAFCQLVAERAASDWLSLEQSPATQADYFDRWAPGSGASWLELVVPPA